MPGMVKLVLERLLPGDYELVIYAHNCLSNVGSGNSGLESLRMIDLRARVDAKVVRWVAKDDFRENLAKVQLASLGWLEVPAETLDVK
jgi:hypothetical protein